MATSFEVHATTHVATGGLLPTFSSFRLGRESRVDPTIIAAGAHFAPCFVDDNDGRVVFAEVPASLDLRREAFAFVELHCHAQRLIAITYDELRAVAADQEATPQLVFVFNTSRCGSTLLHRVFNQVPGVSSIGELSFVSDLQRMAMDPGCRRLVVRLLRDTICLTAAAFGGTVSFKHLSGCTQIADLHYAAFPNASNLFLYRNAVDWAASWQRIRERDGVHDVDMSMWLDAMDAYLRCTDSGTPLTALRYEDLNANPRAALTSLFRILRWPVSAVESALSAFTRDAQEGTDLARVDGCPNSYNLTDSQRRSVEQQLRQHHPSWPMNPLVHGTLRVPQT